MFEAVINTPQLGKYELVSIMGAFQYMGKKLIRHSNDKTRNPICGK